MENVVVEIIAFNAIQSADKADSVVLGKFDTLKDNNRKLVLDANRCAVFSIR